MKERVLKYINPGRREFLRKILAGAVFASPVISTFSVETLTPTPAYGGVNMTGPVCIEPTAVPTTLPTSVCHSAVCKPPSVVPTTPVNLACPGPVDPF